MKNILKHIAILLFTGVVLSGCLPDPAEEKYVYKGPTVVEIKNHTLGIIADSRVSMGGATYGLDWRGVLSTSSTGQTDSTRAISLVGYTIPNPAGTPATTPPRVVSPRTIDTVLVQLVGPHRATSTEVSFETFDASVRNTAGTVTVANAIEGTDYTFEPNNARTITIPANSSVGRIIIRPNAASFTGTERKRLGIRLLGAPDAPVNINYDTFYITMTRTN